MRCLRSPLATELRQMLTSDVIGAVVSRANEFINQGKLLPLPSDPWLHLPQDDTPAGSPFTVFTGYTPAPATPLGNNTDPATYADWTKVTLDNKGFPLASLMVRMTLSTGCYYRESLQGLGEWEELGGGRE